jgi:hypothetical protein
MEATMPIERETIVERSVPASTTTVIDGGGGSPLALIGGVVVVAIVVLFVLWFTGVFNGPVTIDVPTVTVTP